MFTLVITFCLVTGVECLIYTTYRKLNLTPRNLDVRSIAARRAKSSWLTQRKIVEPYGFKIYQSDDFYNNLGDKDEWLVEVIDRTRNGEILAEIFIEEEKKLAGNKTADKILRMN